MEILLKDKIVLVTGGSRGIGAGIVKLLGEAQATVAVHYSRSAKAAEELAAEAGNGSQAFGADLADPDAVMPLVEAVLARYGRIDVLINNAGISIGRTPLPEVKLEDMRRLFDVNLFGVWHGAAIFGKRMIASP